jgi:hypothetical protein
MLLKPASGTELWSRCSSTPCHSQSCGFVGFGNHIPHSLLQISVFRFYHWATLKNLNASGPSNYRQSMDSSMVRP